MIDYEISNNNVVLGNVHIFKNNIKNNFDNSIINYTTTRKYKFNEFNLQTYIINVTINDIDDLYDIISNYKKDKIFEEIDKIKEYNNIKTIKKNTKLDIIIKKQYLKYFKYKSINKESVLESKLYFIKNTLDLEKYQNILNEYNSYKNNSLYEFMTDEEKNNKLDTLIKNIDEIIKKVETNTTYKYGIDYIKPIRLN
mgnify:CR=1 FL=1